MSIDEKRNSIFTKKYIITLILLVLITLFVNLFIVGFAVVSGPSMEPTLESGDIVLVNKLSETYDRFDVVIINTSQEKIIKRIIVLPGETVQIKKGFVYVNGSQIDDVICDKTEFAGVASEPITLKKGEYFVLGDNRANSKDSRYKEVGIIKKDQIIGRATFSIIELQKLK